MGGMTQAKAENRVAGGMVCITNTGRRSNGEARALEADVALAKVPTTPVHTLQIVLQQWPF